MLKQTLIINKLYTIPIVGGIKFGTLPQEVCIETFSDGRVLSLLIERLLDDMFTNITLIPKCKPYDFVDDKLQKLDEKTFTKNGCKFMPSNMIGSGRKYNREDFEKHLDDTNMGYIIADGTQLADDKIRIKWIDGHVLLDCYPNATIPHNHLEFIMNNDVTKESCERYKKDLGKQGTGRKRDTIDKFYTSKDVTTKYIDEFKSHVMEDDLIIEPSAGDGVWIEPLRMYNLVAYDIKPEGEGIQQQDFLELDLNVFQQDLHFIGNPPFGRQSSLAKKFIKRICACERTKTIAFILPKSFKKTSQTNVFPPHYHLEYQDDVSDNAFLRNGLPYNVPCVFQIWKKRDTKRFIPAKIEPKGYTFVNKKENPDYSLRRVGVNASVIDSNIDKSIQSHYFIKIDEDVDFCVDTYNQIVWEHDNTAGPKSISKQEFARELNKMISVRGI
jgi:hypothetical protein